MADVIRLTQRPRKVARVEQAIGAGAQILLFTGVRYERLDGRADGGPAKNRPSGGKRAAK
ncbi:hypothetical protein SAMN05880582_10780 [Rhizobium sp. RU20A]|uniref:hypothetical protein n=1 Tax=Rhizobium sp. RU20A TaxID=1907412 RepID=UPI000954EF72|nr:hypothetical protein [Rhizobium sp. RU20A]SIR16287.1 hypothetical protein SAMN05880582_10780 [Rhizobium sp. RU20A]